MLAFAREPSPLMQIVTVKDGQAQLRSRENHWNSVWIELYTEAAWRGLKRAATTWHIERMYSPPGYVGKDKDFVELPFDARGARLFRRRLELAFKRGFTNFNQARRKAALGARFKSVELFDELMTIDASEMIRSAWRTQPLTTMLQRIRYENPNGPLVHNQTYWINFRTPGAFTVVWVYDWKGPRPLALLEIDSFPGFYFQADAAALSGLNKAAFFKVLGENATALGLFLIVYLQVLGFALDIISAGASGSLAQVLVNYASNYLVGAATEAAMDIAGIENPWARMAVGTVVGFVNLTPNIDLPKVNIPLEGPHISTGHPGPVERGIVDTATPPREAPTSPVAPVETPVPGSTPPAITREPSARAPDLPGRKPEAPEVDKAARIERGLNPQPFTSLEATAAAPVDALRKSEAPDVDKAARVERGLDPQPSVSRQTRPQPTAAIDTPHPRRDRPPSSEEKAFAKPSLQRRLDAEAADQAKACRAAARRQSGTQGSCGECRVIAPNGDAGARDKAGTEGGGGPAPAAR